MKKILRFLGYSVGVLTITIVTMTTIAFTYNISEKTLFGDIYKALFCGWVFLIFLWGTLFFVEQFKETNQNEL